MRIDRWLWAARFYRTRSLASAAVTGGHVHLAGRPVKPGREVRVGDRLEITAGRSRFVVDVLALAERRGSAADAQRLYAETAESRAERERVSELRRLAPAPAPDLGGRPTKRDRRRFERERGR